MKITESQLRQKIRSLLKEMAVPSQKIQDMTFYHGTPTKAAADGIMSRGIVPPDNKGKKGMGWLKPVEGAAYITPHLEYAVQYMNSYYMKDEEEPYGYLFEVPGTELKDVQPDEDSVGELLTTYKQAPGWLKELFMRVVSPSWQKKVREGEYIYFAKVGKMLLSRMTDWQKIDLITNWGTHVANMGPLKPTKCWRLAKSKRGQLSPDASNFFELAERVF